MGRNLNHRPIIHFPSIEIVVRHRKDHDCPSHQTAEIHMRRIRIDALREKAEDEDNNAIADSKGIEQHAPDPRHVEGTPDQLISLPGVTGHLIGRSDRPANTVPEEEGLGEKVGSVQAAHADGDDIVECCGGADVDQTDGAGDASHDPDCVDGNSRV